MIPVPAGVRIYLAMGATDMRKSFDGLALLVQEVLKKDPYSGHPGKIAPWLPIPPSFWPTTRRCVSSSPVTAHGAGEMGCGGAGI